MKGSYEVMVANANVRYDFTIRRNITIIKGNSATGKTTLVEMIREHYESGISSGVTLKCRRACRVLSGRDWKLILSVIKEHIIFIDEDNTFLPTREFAEAVRGSDNYYVIVTRESLPNLPYSVEEIYGIRESGKYASLKQTYHEFFRIYGREDALKLVKVKQMIVEDSNAGYEFFAGLLKTGGDKVISAGGKSNIFAELLKRQEQDLFVIADGAAFGPEMDRIMKLISQRKRIVLYLPESFEWLILKSGVVEGQNLKQCLDRPEDFIESSRHFSWERFFTDVLVSATKDSYLQYSKRKLNEVYLHKDISEKIAEQMPGIEFA